MSYILLDSRSRSPSVRQDLVLNFMYGYQRTFLAVACTAINTGVAIADAEASVSPAT